jgi:hypothetical protein
VQVSSSSGPLAAAAARLGGQPEPRLLTRDTGIMFFDLELPLRTVMTDIDYGVRLYRQAVTCWP